MQKIYLQVGLMSSLLVLGACAPLASSIAESNASTQASPRTVALMKTSVTVEVDGPNVVVHTRYENVTDRLIFIKRGTWGISREHSDVVNGAEEEFAINQKSSGVGLQFNGLIVHRVTPWGRADFTSIEPGEVGTSSVRLGPLTQEPLKGLYLYQFLPGTHEYEIRRRYVLFDEKQGTFQGWWTEPVVFTFTRPQGQTK
ncbi:hypothetical protein [Variovorax sp. OV700]|uniref:hypothetical protein n=1 Tax=Variovorax sp. OV700 TaxID=1882826 RepID=UPI00088BD8BA|nr:hypothetical protein [Variovorax sp. OV700]SDJ82896.1 hypothetical protein SAMN05444748_1292 [Variovorax sp. OV700]